MKNLDLLFANLQKSLYILMNQSVFLQIAAEKKLYLITNIQISGKLHNLLILKMFQS